MIRAASRLCLLATVAAALSSTGVAADGPSVSPDVGDEMSAPTSVVPADEGTAPAGVTLLSARALFRPSAETLSVAGEAALERLVERLANEHAIDAPVLAIRVTGHTDGLGPADYNLLLSERRAATVGALLSRHYPDVPIVVEGAGESSPVASDATPAGRTLNRRVVIAVVTGDARAVLLPGAAATSIGGRR